MSSQPFFYKVFYKLRRAAATKQATTLHCFGFPGFPWQFIQSYWEVFIRIKVEPQNLIRKQAVRTAGITGLSSMDVL